MQQVDVGLWRAVSGIVMVMALGGALPLWLPRKERLLELGLSAAAGVLLATAFLHLIPEAYSGIHAAAGAGVLAGFVFLYLFERFVTVHICEAIGCHVHTVGMSALFGLSIHTLANGIALGAGVMSGMGGVVFMALAAHKLPEAFSLTTILLHENYRRWHIVGMNLLFMTMIPFGVWIIRLWTLWSGPAGEHHTSLEWALAFSAGTFIHVAVSDLLPEVHKSNAHRAVTTAAFLAGILLVGVLGHFVHEG